MELVGWRGGWLGAWKGELMWSPWFIIIISPLSNIPCPCPCSCLDTIVYSRLLALYSYYYSILYFTMLYPLVTMSQRYTTTLLSQKMILEHLGRLQERTYSTVNKINKAQMPSTTLPATVRTFRLPQPSHPRHNARPPIHRELYDDEAQYIDPLCFFDFVHGNVYRFHDEL